MTEAHRKFNEWIRTYGGRRSATTEEVRQAIRPPKPPAELSDLEKAVFRAAQRKGFAYPDLAAKLANGADEDLTVDQFVESLRSEYGSLFPSAGSADGGSQGSGATQRTASEQMNDWIRQAAGW